MKKGFTLIELVIVVIILGVLVAIAVPMFQSTRSKAESAEALNVLGALRSGQLRYYAQNSAYANDCANLDAGYTALKYHTTPPTCINNTAPSAFVTITNPGKYTMCMDSEGVIKCADVAAGTCAKLGYTAGVCP